MNRIDSENYWRYQALFSRFRRHMDRQNNEKLNVKQAVEEKMNLPPEKLLMEKG